MLHKNAIKYVKQEYTLIFIYYVIRFGSVRIPKLRYSVFRYFARFGPPLLPQYQFSMIHTSISFIAYYFAA